MVPIEDLRPNPANPNKHPGRQLELYAAAIRAHGWRESVTVSKRSGLVVRGHGAILAARLIGAALIPVEFQPYASEEEELADLLADNRLKAALKKLPEFAITGYSSNEIADLLAELAPPPEFPITTLSSPSITKPTGSSSRTWSASAPSAASRTPPSAKAASFRSRAS